MQTEVRSLGLYHVNECPHKYRSRNVCVCLWNDLATKATWKIHLQTRTKGVWYERRARVVGVMGGRCGVFRSFISSDPQCVCVCVCVCVCGVDEEMLASAQVSGQRAE